MAGVLGWLQWRKPVRADDVAEFLNKSVGAGKISFSNLGMSITRLDDADLQLAVAATARTVFALYAKIDSTDYLQGTLKMDPDSTADVRRLLADNEASQRPEFSRLRPFPPDPYQAVIVRMTAPAGMSFGYQGVIAAHRDGERWSFTLVSGAFGSGYRAGEARSTFGSATFLAGDANDDLRLRALASGFQAFSDRVSETRNSLETARAATVNLRREAFMARIAPGSVFGGVAIRTGEQQGTALYLEIIGLTPGNGVTALLRNAGGWHYARAFDGSWSADDQFENATLNLSSPPDQAIRNAGPFLENTQTWTFALRMDPKGNLFESNRFFQYRLQYLNAGQVPPLKAALEAEFDGATSLTAPGSLYHGTAVSKASGVSEPVLLRFGGRSADRESVQAAIESTSRSWKRPLHGTIIGNSRRSGGEPVRLRSGAKEAVDEAPAESVLGDRDDLEIRLGAGEGSLEGEDDRFTYRFATVQAGDLTSLDASRAARAARFNAVLREGIAYDGVIRDDQGSVTEARLSVARIDRQKGTIAASVHSLVQLRVYQDFLGTCNPSDASITLDSTGKGEFDTSDSLAVPFLVAPVPHTLQLALIGNAITGGIKGDPQWAMEFPVGVFLAAPCEGAEPGSPPADGSVFPSFPKSGGAYVLSAGTWKPVPRNNGHVVVETTHPMTEDELTGGPLGLVSLGVRRLSEKGQKLSYLEFDGKDPRPEADGPSVTLLFVGPASSGPPFAELAPLEVLKDGKRRIQIEGGSPEAKRGERKGASTPTGDPSAAKELPSAPIRFGEQRSAAYVRRPGPGFILLTTTAAPPAGPYAFNADAGYELTIK